MIIWKGKLKAIKPMKTGFKVILHTTSVPDELDMLQYTGDEGHFAFCVDEFKETVLKAIEDKRTGIVDNKKMTQSQRIRGLIFQVFVKKYPQYARQDTKEAVDRWDDAYKKATEKDIEYWTSKL